MRVLLVCLLVVSLIAASVRGEDKPAEDPAAASAKKAREILAAAAARQNAGDLAEPGKLSSLHIVFHEAEFERQKPNDKGELVYAGRVATDVDGLVIDWMLGSLKTQVTMNGETTTKGFYAPRGSAWISDGTKSSLMTGEDRRTDRAQLDQQRAIVDRLVDVAILGKLLAARDRWRVADEKDPKSVAIERVAAPGVPPLVLRIARLDGGGFGDVIGAEIPPEKAGGVPQFQRFTYHAKYPEVRRKGADGAMGRTEMRFPFTVDVEEPPRPGETARRNVFHVKAVTVDVNTLKDLDFAQPKPK